MGGLQEALKALEQVNQSLAHGNDALASYALRTPTWANLSESYAEPQPSVSVMESWKAYLSEPDKGIAKRDMKRLCWEPSVAFDPKFTEVLTTHFGERLPERSQAGLVYSIASRWDEWVAGNAEVNKLRDYLFSTPRFAYAASIGRFVDGLEGVKQFVLVHGQKFPDVAASLQTTFKVILTGTPYEMAVRKVMGLSQAALLFSENPVPRKWLAEQVLKHLEKTILIAVLSRAIEQQNRQPTEDALTEFRDFLLEYKELGDPRADGGDYKWRGVSADIRKRVSEWLSQEDIRVFFETFFDEGKDRQGRKAFWTQYAHRVRRTRVLVGEDDEGKRSRLTKTMRESSTIGRIKDAEGSAFVMDFGDVIVVEFSRANNACYIYPPGVKCAVTAKFWDRSFSTGELKNRSVGNHFSHMSHWQAKFERELALIGIRPQANRR